MLRNIFLVTLMIYSVFAQDWKVQHAEWNALPYERHFTLPYACTACKWIVNTVKEEITPQSTQEEIKALLHMACTLIPPPLPLVCNFIVDKYVDILARLITQADPDVVCKSIRLCKK